MTEQRRRRTFNRILVTLDSTRINKSALESAALLAETMQYELVGLFIEDSDLMALASLPFSTEVRTTGVVQKLDPAEVQKEVASSAAAARYAIRQVAGRHQIRWSFRSVRGGHGAEFSEATEEMDILCVSRRRSDRYRRAAMQNPVRMVLEKQSPILVAGQLSGRIDKPIAIIVDREVGSSESLRLAGQIAAKAKTGLVVLEFLPLDADISRVRDQIESQLPVDVTLRTVLVGRDDPCGLLDILRRNDYSLALYGVHEGMASPAWLDYVTDAGDCPLLLVPED